MSTILVTGSSRGLGLELIKQLASTTGEQGLVIATARKCSSGLSDVIDQVSGRVAFVALDTSSESSIRQSVAEVQSLLGERRLDVLINCAGAHSWLDGKVSQMADLDYQLSINVTGTHNVIRSYLPLMRGGQVKKVINIASSFGTITNARLVDYAPCPAYKISKVALNALTVQYALSYEDEGFVFLSVNPGWLRTEMGGAEADLEVAQGAQAVVEVVRTADRSYNGTFKNVRVAGWEEKYDGADIPW